MLSPSMALKSLTLRVARDKLLLRAVAAIWPSSVAMICPRRMRPATSSAYSTAQLSSKGNVRSAKSCLNICSAANANRSRLLPAGRRAIPKRISARVMVLTKNLEFCCASNQSSTPPAGFERMSSDSTLVSSSMLSLAQRSGSGWTGAHARVAFDFFFGCSTHAIVIHPSNVASAVPEPLCHLHSSTETLSCHILKCLSRQTCSRS